MPCNLERAQAQLEKLKEIDAASVQPCPPAVLRAVATPLKTRLPISKYWLFMNTNDLGNGERRKGDQLNASPFIYCISLPMTCPGIKYTPCFQKAG